MARCSCTNHMQCNSWHIYSATIPFAECKWNLLTDGFSTYTYYCISVELFTNHLRNCMLWRNGFKTMLQYSCLKIQIRQIEWFVIEKYSDRLQYFGGNWFSYKVHRIIWHPIKMQQVSVTKKIIRYYDDDDDLFLI